MPSPRNKVVIACAGSGKTTHLVRDALLGRDRRIAFLTYTNFNRRAIRAKFEELHGGLPKHVHLMTWFGFLLRQCARPYQRAKYPRCRIESIAFVNQRSAKGIPERDTRRHYFAGESYIYSDKIAKFAMECERQTGGAVTGRLSEIYSDIFVDEFQDLAGWDLDVIQALMTSGIRVRVVGDPRQHIYDTNPAQKNSQYAGAGVVDLVGQWEKHGWCSVEKVSETFRCDEKICAFSNGLWPGFEPMRAVRKDSSGHDGVYLVGERAVAAYIKQFAPQVLRYNRRAPAFGSEALNFGVSKGLQFDRVLVVPTEAIRKYLGSGNIADVMSTRDKLHVAVTRARRSVAFVYDGDSPVVPMRWVR